MRNKLFVSTILLVSPLIPCFSFAQSTPTENLTITTYYPSPQGQYGVIKLNPRPKPAPPCQEGEITYDNNAATRGLYFCNSTNQWASLYNGFWAEDLATHNIHNTNIGGRVGINATNPASKLSVQGGNLTNLPITIQELISNVSTTQYLRTITSRNGGGNTWNTAELYLRRNVFSDRGFIKWPAGNQGTGIGFGSAASEYMRVTQSGNVGIGTMYPSQKLEVSGNIRVSKTTPTAAEGNITVHGDVCNSAGKCLNQLP